MNTHPERPIKPGRIEDRRSAGGGDNKGAGGVQRGPVARSKPSNSGKKRR